MRCVLSLVLLMLPLLSLGCVSTTRPQPLARSTPADQGREVAIDTPTASDKVGKPVADTSSSTSLSSRFTKLFSRSDASDRMPLPRNDQPLENGGDAARRDLGRDF
ncbi:MAG TPA: hypothetical protein VFG04_00350 [Planctomycetaceae bacterium]|jgi:hypothetical protein|nr:hypothetical protein [Planctomycetaceae bacterium]